MADFVIDGVGYMVIGHACVAVNAARFGADTVGERGWLRCC